MKPLEIQKSLKSLKNENRAVSFLRAVSFFMICALAVAVLASLGALGPKAGTSASLYAAQPGPSGDSVEAAEAALVESMKARLPVLMQLKLSGRVGESNMGLLKARGDLEREQRRLISAENSDRLAHYKMIATKLGVPVAAVQRKRAEQIRENSPSGVWIESKDGDWLQK